MTRTLGVLEAIPAWAWLTALVGLSAALLALEGLGMTMPIVYVDELVYSNAAKQVAAGTLPGFDGRAYGYGLVYPLLLAPAYRVLAHTQDAYAAVKAVNAVVFSLAAVPTYLLARRVARQGLALGVAALTLLLPAREYASLVLTESVAFLVFLVAVLTVVRVLERPTVGRQLTMLALCALAFETRRQLLVLAVAMPLMLVVAAFVERRSVRGVLHPLARRYAVTWIAVGVAAAGLVVVTVVRGGGPGSAIGPYSVLVSSYDVLDIARWAAYHVAVYGLTLGVIGLIALPFGLVSCLRRDAPPPFRAIGVATVVLVPAFLLQVAVFSSTTYGLDRIHERYLFYVAPLVLAVLAHWIDTGLPHARTALGLTVATVVVALPLLLPAHGLPTFAVDAPVLHTLGYGPDASSGPATAFRGLVLWISLLLALWVFLVHPRHGALLLAVVALAFVIVDVRVRSDFQRDARRWQGLATGGRAGLPRNWVDEAIGKRTAVSVLFVSPPPGCPSRGADVAHAITANWRAAFFNSGIRSVVALNDGLDIGVPSKDATLRPDGRVVAGGHAVVARYVLADRRLPVEGRRIAVDAATGLGLWQTRASLRLDAVTGDAKGLRALVCGGPTPTPPAA